VLRDKTHGARRRGPKLLWLAWRSWQAGGLTCALLICGCAAG
jgi:hypothetical protein